MLIYCEESSVEEQNLPPQSVDELASVHHQIESQTQFWVKYKRKDLLQGTKQGVQESGSESHMEYRRPSFDSLRPHGL